MNGIQAITAQIIADAQTEADRILAQARARAKECLSAYQEQAYIQSTALLERSERESALREERLSHAAILAARNLRLSTEQEMRERAFAAALKQLSELPDGEYGLFVAFMQDKEMDFESETQEAVKDLRKKAEREKYLDRISGELDAIGEKLKDDKNTDLELFGDEIRKLIGDEIILRYHYETGVARHTALHDPEVRQAVEVLKDQNRYRQIVTSQDTPRK